MHAISFPPSAATSLLHGYCDDFIALAASMAQTLEQASMRGLPLDDCAADLARVERGMRDLAEAIGALLRRQGAAGQPAAWASSPTAAPTSAPASRGPSTSNSRANVRAATPPSPPPPPAPTAAWPTPPTHADEEPRAAGLRSRGPSPARQPAPPPPAAPQKAPPPVDPSRVPPRPSAGSMLAGSNDTMPLRSVFQFISRMRKSGTLRIVLDDEDMTFDVADGCLIATTSSAQETRERLGDLLVELSFISPMDLETFVRMQGHTLRQLGGTLVREGRITEGQLLQALELQVSRRYHRAITAKQATYDFRESPRPRGDGRIRIRAFELRDGDPAQ